MTTSPTPRRRRPVRHRADRDPRGDGAVLPRLRDVGHRVACAARRARRPQAGAPPDPLGMRRRASAPTVPREVRSRHRRRHGQVPPPRRLGDLRRAGAHGADFSLRHPLIDLHGNFGHPDDSPAAARYTECRLDPLAMQLLADIDEDTVDFPTTTTAIHRARGAAGPLPEPAGQRQPGHRGRHGHQHPAAQPR